MKILFQYIRFMPLIQLTGLSGAGKTTISNLLKNRFRLQGRPFQVLDGDECRQVLCRDLGFSMADRKENIRRISYVGNLLSGHNIVVVTAAINPYEDVRMEVEQLYGALTVYISCPVNELIRRDTKGLYQRALLPEGDPGKLHCFTGINDPYEIPVKPHLVLDTLAETPETSADRLFQFLCNRL